jgi:hypothetical protein
MAWFFIRKLLIIKYVFWFSWQVLSKTFLVLARTKWDMVKNVYWPPYKNAHYSYQIIIKLKFSWHIFEKWWNIIFHENSYSGSRVIPFGWTHKIKLIAASQLNKPTYKETLYAHTVNIEDVSGQNADNRHVYTDILTYFPHIQNLFTVTTRCGINHKIQYI